MLDLKATVRLQTVWIYINSAKEVSDVDHLKVFVSEDAAGRWFTENDPEGAGVRVSTPRVKIAWG